MKPTPETWLTDHFYAVVRLWKGFKHTPQPLDPKAELKSAHMSMMSTALRKSRMDAAESEVEHKKARGDIGKLSNRKGK
jgi:hypothetical protein